MKDSSGSGQDSDSGEDLDAQLGIPKAKKSKGKRALDASHDKIEVNFDDISDDDQECLLDYQPGQSKQPPGLLEQEQ